MQSRQHLQQLLRRPVSQSFGFSASFTEAAKVPDIRHSSARLGECTSILAFTAEPRISMKVQGPAAKHMLHERHSKTTPGGKFQPR